MGTFLVSVFDALGRAAPALAQDALNLLGRRVGQFCAHRLAIVLQSERKSKRSRGQEVYTGQAYEP